VREVVEAMLAQEGTAMVLDRPRELLLASGSVPIWLDHCFLGRA